MFYMTRVSITKIISPFIQKMRLYEGLGKSERVVRRQCIT